MKTRDEIILEICVMVTKDAELREIVKERTKVAGLVGGDIQLYSGAGQASAAALPTNSRPRDVAEIIKSGLTEEQKTTLIDSVSRFFEGIHFFTAIDGLAQLTETLDLKFQVRQAIIAFLKRSVNVHVWSTKTLC